MVLRIVTYDTPRKNIILKLYSSMSVTTMRFVSILMVVMTVFVELEHLVMAGTFVSQNIVQMDGMDPIQLFVSKFQIMLRRVSF